MMIIINEAIAFDDKKRTLKSSSTAPEKKEVEIQLSNPASRILSLFLEKNNLVLNRADIISHTWGDYSKFSSNASLNNYISELRKSFKILEENENIITTIPRVGIMFSANKIKAMAVGDDLHFDTPPKNKTINLTGINEKAVINKKRYCLKHLTLALVILASLITIFNIYREIKIKHTLPLIKISSQNKCSIYGLDHRESSSEYANKILQAIQENKINCDSKYKDIYYYGNIVSPDTNTAELLVECIRSDEGKHIFCKNFKSVHFETN
ncbi:hypothetical protein AR325_26105 (plasmid) [Serratia marcescens]|uniref:winged helix-turn-helix domain-containing protein n=1 Tax=Serratia marcescens TaxID=615 RepID=UPI0006ECFA22|nr:winged helix-turn-helix domain-containing protein [Serratia marcescens]ALL40490.1 hypothetical protein AR325_26105 [Serratia marcescens]